MRARGHVARSLGQAHVVEAGGFAERCFEVTDGEETRRFRVLRATDESEAIGDYGMLFPSEKQRAANELKTAAYVIFRNSSGKTNVGAFSKLS